MHSRLPVETAGAGAQPRRRAPALTRKNAFATLLDLQHTAGNHVVSRLVGRLPAVQRVELYVNGGGKVTSINGPGTNDRKAVAIVQARLLTLGALTAADAAADRARMKANKGRLSAGDIPATLAAITRCETTSLLEHAAKKVLKVDLVAGVGTGETNDADDVELVLNLLHEESYVTNDEFNRSEVVLSGDDRTVDPAALPGFLPGLTKLKRGFAAGYPFRGSTRRRKGLKVTAGTAAYQKALAYNMAGRSAMNAWLAQAAAQTKDKVLRNSAQWCLGGTFKVYCKTATHDSAARVRAEGQPRRFVANFGYPQGALSEQQVPYLRKRRGDPAFDNTNVEIEPPSGGARHADGIDVVDPVEAGKAYFFETIKHEVQHEADHHPSTDEGHYKTELNARWVDGSYAGYSPRRRVQRMGFTWNERQYAIFRNLWANHDLYPYLKDNWTQTDRAKRSAWRSMVVAYTKPVTANPINSVRIQELDDTITACTPADCAADDLFRAAAGPENARATAVKNALAALDSLDKSTVRSNTDLRTKAASRLSGKLLADFQSL